MKLYIKQQTFTLGERFYVKDHHGNDKYYVEGSFLKFPKQFKIYDMSNKLVSIIERQMTFLLPKYIIKTNDRTMKIKQNVSFLSLSFSIENSSWRIVGDFLNSQYSLMNNSKPLMYLKKHWFTWGDSYELDIVSENDEILCLSIAIVVDAARMNSA